MTATRPSTVFNEVRFHYRVHLVHSMPWASVQELKVKGIFNKKLLVQGAGDNGLVSIKAGIPNTLFGLLAPMRNNLPGARTIEGHFKSGAAAQAPQLYGPPSSGVPALNAPGYTPAAASAARIPVNPPLAAQYTKQACTAGAEAACKQP
jgi:hypothetical protein